MMALIKAIIFWIRELTEYYLLIIWAFLPLEPIPPSISRLDSLLRVIIRSSVVSIILEEATIL